MKKQFETPIVNVSWFSIENIIVTSGGAGNVET